MNALLGNDARAPATRWCRSTPAIRRATSAPDGIFDYLRSQLPVSSGQVDRPRRRRGVAVCRARQSDASCSTCTWIPCRHRRRGRTIRSHCSVTDDRAIGLGACDIKGAAAALLDRSRKYQRRRRAVCSRSDEEANDARCISAFLRRSARFDASDRCRADALRGGAGASRHQFGACRFARPCRVMPRRRMRWRQRAASGHALGRARARISSRRRRTSASAG